MEILFFCKDQQMHLIVYNILKYLQEFLKLYVDIWVDNLTWKYIKFAAACETFSVVQGVNLVLGNVYFLTFHS